MSTPLEVLSTSIPLWKGAPGSISIHADIPSPNDKLPVSPTAIADAEFNVNQTIGLTTAQTVSIGVAAQTSFRLAPLWFEQQGADPTLVTDFDLAPALTKENLLLAMDLGGNAAVSGAGSFQYGALTVGANLNAGADARFVAVRSYPRDATAQTILDDFFGKLALPGAITEPPPANSLSSLEFGGYLKFGVNAAAGYQIQGTPSFQFSQIALSEHYTLSVTGKLSVDASLAGRFSVEVRPATDPHWARVTVRRRRSRDLSIAGDLNVGASIDTQDLPASGKEFLEALLGLRAKNWLNLADQIVSQSASIHTAQDLTTRLDGLADIYISRYVNRAVSDLLPNEVVDLMAKLQHVVNSYNNLDQSAVTLFDRYFDGGSAKLTGFLQQLQALTSWDQLKGDIGAPLWNIVQQLTDGDPLTWMLGQTMTLFQQRVTDALSLIQDNAHSEIRKYIALAKGELGLDHFASELNQVDSPDKLAAKLSDASQHIAERIIGAAVKNLQGTPLKNAFTALTNFAQQIQDKSGVFFKKFDQILQEAASQSFSLDIAAAYHQADESTALIDLDIRLQNDDRTASVVGQRFMQLAGRGDFSGILKDYRPDLIRLHSGALTHQLASSTGVQINIAGWHTNFHYQEMYKVVVNSDQQIRSTPSGMLNVFTTVDMSAEHGSKRKTSHAEQEMHSNFTLRFLAETHNAVNGASFDRAHSRYLLDVITGQAAIYTSSFSDSATTDAKLTGALSFAKYLQLDREGATKNSLAPFLQLKAGNYGPLRFDYSVRYTEGGLSRLFQTPVSADQIRTILRAIIVNNYSNDPNLSSAAWLYCSDQVRAMSVLPAFLQSETLLKDALNAKQITMDVPIDGITSPPLLSADQTTRNALVSFFSMENDMITAFAQLQNVLRNRGSLTDLEKRLNAFGHALNTIEKNASIGGAAVSPEFAVFDQLIGLATTAAEARNSALAITAGSGKAAHNLLFQRRAVPAVKTVTATATSH